MPGKTKTAREAFESRPFELDPAQVESKAYLPPDETTFESTMRLTKHRCVIEAVERHQVWINRYGGDAICSVRASVVRSEYSNDVLPACSLLAHCAEVLGSELI